MLILLVLIIVLILLFGSSAVLGAALGILGWIVGLILTIAFLVWASTTFDVDPSSVMLLLVLGVPGGLFALIYVGYLVENRKRPDRKKQTFQEYWKEHSGS